MSNKIKNAWAFYDWANSVYPLVITSTIFPIYYDSITRTGNSDVVNFFGLNIKNSSLYTFALAFAYLLIAIFSPFLSGMADSGGNKKQFMRFFCYLGALSCSGLYFFTPEHINLGIFLIITACVGYSGSIVFYNAYLPEVADKNEQDTLSARGFALGYTGSSILLIFNLIMILKPEFFGGLSKGLASRISFLMTGIWWIVFAQYTFRHLPRVKKQVKSGFDSVYRGYDELKKVWSLLEEIPKIKRYLSAFFVYNMGVQTVMLVATLFGKKEIGMESGELITTILIIQFVAIVGAYLFSYLSGKIGNIITLQLATLIWVLVCIAASFVYTAGTFYILAFVVGMVMGGIQALSRSTYSKMLPMGGEHASFFSFYDVCEKLGIVLGMALFGLLDLLFDSMRVPVIALVIFFLVGFILLFRIRKNEIVPEV